MSGSRRGEELEIHCSGAVSVLCSSSQTTGSLGTVLFLYQQRNFLQKMTVRRGTYAEPTWEGKIPERIPLDHLTLYAFICVLEGSWGSSIWTVIVRSFIWLFVLTCCWGVRTRILLRLREKSRPSQYDRSLHRTYPSESREGQCLEGNPSACWLSSISGSGHTGLVCKNLLGCVLIVYLCCMITFFEKSRFYVILKTSIFFSLVLGQRGKRQIDRSQGSQSPKSIIFSPLVWKEMHNSSHSIFMPLSASVHSCVTCPPDLRHPTRGPGSEVIQELFLTIFKWDPENPSSNVRDPETGVGFWEHRPFPAP